jgi:hypothetical protein
VSQAILQEMVGCHEYILRSMRIARDNHRHNTAGTGTGSQEEDVRGMAWRSCLGA